MARGPSQTPSPSRKYEPVKGVTPRDGLPKTLVSSPYYSHVAMYCAGLPKTTVNAACGAIAGVASSITTCPLDVIKTRLQAQSSFRPRSQVRPSQRVYRGLVSTARIIWHDGGVPGLYRGLGPMFLGYIPTWATYMTVYDTAKDRYQERTGWYRDGEALVALTAAEHKWLARMAAAVTAGGCSTLVTNPIWVVKTRLMSQVGSRALEEHRPPWQYKGTFDAFRSMYKSEGLRTFYSGLTPALLGLSHVAIQFPLYEFFRTEFTGLEMGQGVHEGEEKHHWLGVLAATVLSKMCATSATYPHEVLRTRLQTQQRSQPSQSPEEIAFRGGAGKLGHQTRPPGTASSDGMVNAPRYRGVVRTVRTIVQDEGWRAFYNGMGTNMVRAVPAAVVTMLTYESLRSLYRRIKADGLEMLRDDGSAP